MSTLQNSLVAIILAGAWLGCNEPAGDDPKTKLKDPVVAQVDTTTTDPNAVVLVPLSNSRIRTDGWYHSDMGFGAKGIQYYMRFFPRGNVALVGGPEQVHGTLGKMLTENVQSGWNQVHNTPVTLRNDSIIFRTMAIKGAIDYAGVVYANGDSLRFLKNSEVNGQRMIVTYGFEPAPLPQ